MSSFLTTAENISLFFHICECVIVWRIPPFIFLFLKPQKTADAATALCVCVATDAASLFITIQTQIPGPTSSRTCIFSCFFEMPPIFRRSR
ncbi:Uncharacterized protein APZ42_014188 [Daphnia magna]|uniref:Uncharacterized protein n=1 Tax=Daphnia magna TaxID=35525 RepID=A0A162Q1K6_9CRUS|nr:Uncharacterized protein APZ42_014188 [Daphnia magna]